MTFAQLYAAIPDKDLQQGRSKGLQQKWMNWRESV
jgi:hypothetical protein